ncbi:MAG: hypothetical protein IJJ44_03090 [Solobacterium sp.]|nr:hypothetical protein [Solobacterium sp.]
MAKKKYSSPIIMNENPGDATIVIGNSQGTSGDTSVFTFEEGFPASVIALIEGNCDDMDLQDMDSDHNYVITYEEYQAWYDEYGWF